MEPRRTVLTDDLAMGLKACVYEVQVRGEGKDAEIWVEAPRPVGQDGEAAPEDREWELVDIRGVSEGRSDLSLREGRLQLIANRICGPSYPLSREHVTLRPWT